MSVELWQQCVELLRDELPAQQFNTWIRPLQVEGDGDELRVYAPNRFVLDWVNEKYLSRLLELLSELPDVNRDARYVAVLALMQHEDDATPIICQGTWDGEIVLEPQGDQGFGYDPYFFVPEKGCTAAQLPAEEKNAISHRGKAMKKLLEQLTVNH